MTTVGYGDIMIVNNTERLVAMFAMIVGGACFGYIIGGVTSILEDLDLSSSMYNEKMDAVKEYIYDRQYPPVLAAQIKKHFKSILKLDKKFHVYVHGGEECELHNLLYFKKQPKKFDIMICIPIINYQFNINQLLNIKESSKMLTAIEARALIYQGILITTNIEKKLELMNALKNSFKTVICFSRLD